MSDDNTGDCVWLWIKHSDTGGWLERGGGMREDTVGHPRGKDACRNFTRFASLAWHANRYGTTTFFLPMESIF